MPDSPPGPAATASTHPGRSPPTRRGEAVPWRLALWARAAWTWCAVGRARDAAREVAADHAVASGGWPATLDMGHGDARVVASAGPRRCGGDLPVAASVEVHGRLPTRFVEAHWLQRGDSTRGLLGARVHGGGAAGRRQCEGARWLRGSTAAPPPLEGFRGCGLGNAGRAARDGIFGRKPCQRS